MELQGVEEGQLTWLDVEALWEQGLELSAVFAVNFRYDFADWKSVDFALISRIGNHGECDFNNKIASVEVQLADCETVQTGVDGISEKFGHLIGVGIASELNPHRVLVVVLEDEFLLWVGTRLVHMVGSQNHLGP